MADLDARVAALMRTIKNYGVFCITSHDDAIQDAIYCIEQAIRAELQKPALHEPVTDAEITHAIGVYLQPRKAPYIRGVSPYTADIRAVLESFLQGRAPAGLSWSGFNLYGDAKSIAKAKSMLHDSDTVVPALRDAITELQGRAKPAQEAPCQPAPPVPDSVQEIMRLMGPYIEACVKFNNAHRGIIDDALVEAEDAFKPLQAALTALVDDNHRLKFELDGVNAMRGPLSDDKLIDLMPEEIPPKYDVQLLQFARAIEKAHGIEPEQGGHHG